MKTIHTMLINLLFIFYTRIHLSFNMRLSSKFAPGINSIWCYFLLVDDQSNWTVSHFICAVCVCEFTIQFNRIVRFWLTVRNGWIELQSVWIARIYAFASPVNGKSNFNPSIFVRLLIHFVGPICFSRSHCIRYWPISLPMNDRWVSPLISDCLNRYLAIVHSAYERVKSKPIGHDLRLNGQWMKTIQFFNFFCLLLRFCHGCYTLALAK